MKFPQKTRQEILLFTCMDGQPNSYNPNSTVNSIENKRLKF